MPTLAHPTALNVNVLAIVGFYWISQLILLMLFFLMCPSANFSMFVVWMVFYLLERDRGEGWREVVCWSDALFFNLVSQTCLDIVISFRNSFYIICFYWIFVCRICILLGRNSVREIWEILLGVPWPGYFSCPWFLV